MVCCEPSPRGGSRRALITAGPRGPRRLGCDGVLDYTLCVDPAGEQLLAARECEAAVFLESYGNTAAQWAEEYGPYESQSVFVAVLDRAGDAVGAARMIMPGDRTVKSLADASRVPWGVDGLRAARAVGLDLDRTWDVGTVAVRSGSGRGGLIASALYHGLIQTLRANRAGWIVMIMDHRARRLLDIAGLRTNVLPGAGPGAYLGSKSSVPLWSELASMMDGQRISNPEAHRLVSLGIGLDGIEVPSPADFTLVPRGAATYPPFRIAL